MLNSSADDSARSVISVEGWFWAKLVAPALRIFRAFLILFLGRRRWKLVFVERTLSKWTSGRVGEKPIIHLRNQLAVTNPSDQDGVVVVRVQIGRAGFGSRRTLQDCHFCDIAGERVCPLTPGVLIKARTTATMQITHPLEVNDPPAGDVTTLSFRIIVTDQLNRRHSKRIRLDRFARNGER